MPRLLSGASLLLVLAASFVHADETRLLRQPALSAEHIAFVYAGDIWLSNRDGSQPRRLTAHPADESQPHFSPDGTQIAFAGGYEGSADVYVISIDGGQPRRLTYHPGTDTPTGWSADGGQVYFSSAREREHGRSGQLYQVSVAGGAPRKVMEARFVQGSFDASGRYLAYIDHGSGYGGLFGGRAGWKGYRGGTTPDVRIMDLRNESLTVIPGAGASNFNPVWLGDQLYFLSDRDDKQFNLYRWDAGNVTRVSHEATWDVRWASGNGSTLAYEAGGRLHLLDTASGAVEVLSIEIRPDLPQLRPRWKSVAGNIQDGHISPTGQRVIVTARGEVFTVPTDEGSTRNLSSTPGTREYHARWSPDGERIAWIEDSLQGQTLIVADQAGAAQRRFALGPHFYELKAWADGTPQRVIFEDNHLNLFAIELERGRITKLDTGMRRESVDVALSPDNAWLAFTREGASYNRDLVMHHFPTGRTVQVTDGMADVAAPAFDRDGKYLFFAASTNSGPVQVGLNMTSQERPYRAGLYAIVLAADGRSPLEPGRGDEGGEEDDDSEENDESDEEQSEEEATRVDLDGIAARIVALQVAERNYNNLAVANDGRLYYVDYEQPGVSVDPPGDNGNGGNVLMRYDFEEREASKLLDGINAFRLSADGKQLLLSKPGGALAVAKVGDKLEPEAVATDGLRMRIDPREEWALIFDEAWRMELEHFYDPGMHGLDWQAVYERFRPLVDHVGRRADLNDLLVEMIAEMQVGHNNVGGGDVYRPPGARTGLLGANFRIDRNRWQLARVYSGESWNPFLRAPLATPGNSAREGEYLLAVNGRELTADDNLFEYLQGTVDTQVSLRVGPRADGRDAREIVVLPVSNERQLRLWRWVEHNRRAVDEATDGRVGYVYLPNTAGAGYTFFNRMFFAQLDRDAVIIDERSNGGGQAANYIIEVLSRRHLSGWKDRDGKVFNTPAGAIYGPKIMLIDQDAGSGGDYLPYSFRELGIGTLMGTRTWGGLIGISYNPPLVDGGRLTVPFFRFYDTDHRWTVENEGVAPDIVVELDPFATNEGRDSQLEAAIAETLRQLESFRDPVPDEAPPYPTELGR